MKKKNFFPWWIFAGCCLISMIGFGLIVNTIGLFFAPIAREFNVGRGTVSLMTTLQNAAAAVSLILAGKIMSEFNLRWLLTTCFLVIGLAIAVQNWANQMWQFYLAWIIIGLFQPFAITLSIPVLLSNWFKRHLGTVMGIALGLSALGGTIFNPIISAAITSWGWRRGLLFEGALILLMLVPVALFLQEKPSSRHQALGINQAEEKQEQDNKGLLLKAALRRPVFYALALAMLLLQFVSGSVQHISGHIVSLGLDLNTGAAVVSGVMLGAAVGKIAIGFLFDKLPQKAVILLFALFGLSGWGGQILFKSPQMLILSAFILGLGQGLCLVGLPYLTRDQFGNRDYANILSVINMLGAFSMAVAVGLDGSLFDLTGSYNTGWLINVFAYAIALISLLATIKPPKAFIK